MWEAARKLHGCLPEFQAGVHQAAGSVQLAVMAILPDAQHMAQYSNGSPDCNQMRRPLSISGSFIAFFCTHLIKHHGIYPPPKTNTTSLPAAVRGSLHTPAPVCCLTAGPAKLGIQSSNQRCPAALAAVNFAAGGGALPTL